MTNHEQGVALTDLAPLMSFCRDSLHLSSEDAANFALLMAATRDDATRVEQQGVSYLPLAPVVASRVTADRAYYAALPYGRALYRDEQYDVDSSTDTLYLAPVRYTWTEVLDVVETLIYLLESHRLQLILPLTWRVGLVVGWLSGLWVSQPDDALNGMVALAALVAPLLVAPATSAPTHFIDRYSMLTTGQALAASLREEEARNPGAASERAAEAKARYEAFKARRAAASSAAPAPVVGQSSKLLPAPSPAVPALESSSATPRSGRLARRYCM